MKYYVVCSDCGYKLLKCSGQSTLEVRCPKCKHLQEVIVNGKEILIKSKIDKLSIK